MGLCWNRRDSTHDIYVGNRRYSAKTTLGQFNAVAKLARSQKIILTGMLPRAMRRCKKKSKIIIDAITRESPRQNM